MRRHVAAAAAMLAMVVGIVGLLFHQLDSVEFVGLHGSAEVSNGQSPISAELEDASRSGAAAEGSWIRIFTQTARRDDSTGRETVGEPRLYGEYAHAGALDDIQPSIETLDRFIYWDSLELQKMDADPECDPVQRAEKYHSIVFYQLAIQALRDGSYITTRAGDDPPPMNIPGAQCIGRGGTVNGEHVGLLVVVPYGRYPELDRSRRSLELAKHFRDWKKAQEFNLLPESERRGIADRVAALLRSKDLSSGDWNWIVRTIGEKVDIDTVNAIVSVRPLGK